jgi:hypothetical protein
MDKDKIWIEYILRKAEQIKFGTIKIDITIKNGKVVNLKGIETTENLNIDEIAKTIDNYSSNDKM